ncbi:acyltransferase family protein [Echinimonas agarilytica]|uniref:Acyltransferase n=1 Tax=Echinimonas agarilytica TaxID=1215918 RepID=A0AA42B8D4_9GAMM|nr:acyltransferase [Echinimonas agarilytica]MCM2680784.1 acyltransferase [Echinimonas agarilytica]
MQQWILERLEISHGDNTPLRAMEGLRGIAVFMVFLVHYSTLVEPWISGLSLTFSHVVHAMGNLGVDLFFVLSGFLIYGTIISKQSFHALAYTRRRIRRIYPTFLVVFSVYLLLSVVFPQQSKLPSGLMDIIQYLVSNLLLLPGIFDIKPMITVAWSLSYELFYYLIIPIVIFACGMKRWSSNTRIMFWLGVSVIGFMLAYQSAGLVRLLMFVAGILVFEAYHYRQLKIWRGGTLCLVAALALFGARIFFTIDSVTALMVVFVLFLILTLNAFTLGSRTSQWLCFAPIRWLGNMSYSYYLWHGLTLKFCFLLLPMIAPATADSALIYYWLWIPLFVITWLSSFVLYAAIEHPFSIRRKPK